MNFRQLHNQLQSAGNIALAIELPAGDFVPAHFHVTEVGNVQKQFIDCGGTLRQESTCVLQTLVAGDVEHRLKTNKLAGILTSTSALAIADDSPVEMEIQGTTIETYCVSSCKPDGDRLVLKLQSKSTACLAEDKCGIEATLPQVEGGCCGGATGCC